VWPEEICKKEDVKASRAGSRSQPRDRDKIPLQKREKEQVEPVPSKIKERYAPVCNHMSYILGSNRKQKEDDLYA